jgi:hypothetical protein
MHWISLAVRGIENVSKSLASWTCRSYIFSMNLYWFDCIKRLSYMRVQLYSFVYFDGCRIQKDKNVSWMSDTVSESLAKCWRSTVYLLHPWYCNDPESALNVGHLYIVKFHNTRAINLLHLTWNCFILYIMLVVYHSL